MFLINPFIYGVTPVTPWTNLKSISFDGIDEIVDCGTISSFSATQNLSYSFWYKTNNSGLNITFIQRSTFGLSYVQLNVEGGSGARYAQAYLGDGGNNMNRSSANSIPDNTWIHIAVVYDGTLTGDTNRLKIFINGVNDTTVGNAGIPSTTATFTTEALQLGGSSVFGYYDACNMDEVSIFDYSLTQTEVTALYNSGCPNDLMELAEAKRPEHYYRMGDNDTYPTITDLGQTGGNNGTMTNQESGDVSTDVVC